MNYTQLILPDLSVVGEEGYCLAYVQAVFGGNEPRRDPSARSSWDRSEFKHTERGLPNVAVPVFFDWQTLGHVVVYIPGDGFYSTKWRGGGHQKFGSIAEIELSMPGKYLGWAEDLEGQRIVQPITQGDDDMITDADWPLIQNATRRVKYWNADQGQEMNAWKDHSLKQWLNEGLNESAQAWQQREDALSRVVQLQADLTTAQQQATDFGKSNVTLSTQVTELQNEITKLNAQITNQSTSTPIQDVKPPVQTQDTPSEVNTPSVPVPTDVPIEVASIWQALYQAILKLFK